MKIDARTQVAQATFLSGMEWKYQDWPNFYTMIITQLNLATKYDYCAKEMWPSFNIFIQYFKETKLGLPVARHDSC